MRKNREKYCKIRRASKASAKICGLVQYFNMDLLKREIVV